MNPLIKFFVGLSGLWASTVMAQEPVTVFDPTVAAITTTTPSAAVALKKRTDIDQKIRMRHGQIASIYQRLFDQDPTAQGQVVLWMKIASNGQVLDISIQKSDINNQDFLNKLIAIIKGIQFESGDFEEIEIDYKWNFFVSVR